MNENGALTAESQRQLLSTKENPGDLRTQWMTRTMGAKVNLEDKEAVREILEEE